VSRPRNSVRASHASVDRKFGFSTKQPEIKAHPVSRISLLVVVALLLASEPLQHQAFGRGFGGFHGGGFGGGGGFRGGFSGGGYRGGGFGGGYRGFGGGGDIGYRGANFGGLDRGVFGGEGFHPNYEGFNSFHSGENFGQSQSIGYRGNDFGGFNNSVRNTGGWAGDAGRFNGSVNSGQLHNFLGLPTDGGLGAAGQSFASHPNIARSPVTADHPDLANGTHSNPYGTHPYSPTWAHSQGNNVQNWAHNHPNGAWNNWHNWAWTPAGMDAGLWAATAWDFAAWPSLSTWLGWDNIVAYPYNYGQYINYDGDNVYYGSQPAGTAEQYYDEASTLAATTPAAPPAGNPQWLPLGIFGLVAGDSQTPTLTFQLAVDKEGTIRGNSSNQYGDVLPIQGAVDKRTQRACWTVGTDKSTVYDTGLDNLTKSESPILVHTGPKHTQQELLVRLNRPAAQASNGSATSTQ
jgi:hypothetical protein